MKPKGDVWCKTRRYFFIVMYQASPGKNGRERVVDKKLEAEIGKLLRRFNYWYVGSGYDDTNKRRDIQYEFVEKRNIKMVRTGVI